MAWTIHKNNNANASSSSSVMTSLRKDIAPMTSNNNALHRQSCHHQYHSEYDKDEMDQDDDASLTSYSTSSSDEDEYYEYSEEDDETDENDLEEEDSSIHGLSIFAAEETMIHNQQKHVTFGSIQIRYYACTVGDHPLCEDSCPLTLDWEYGEYYDDKEDDKDDESFGEESSTSSCNTPASTSPCSIPIHSFSVDSPSHNPHHRHARGWVVPQLSYEQRRARVLHHLTLADHHNNNPLRKTHSNESPSGASSPSSPEVRLQQMEQHLIQKRLQEYIHESPHARTYLQRILHHAASSSSTPTNQIDNDNNHSNHTRVDDNQFHASTTHPAGGCCRGRKRLFVASSQANDDRLRTHQHADSPVPTVVALSIG